MGALHLSQPKKKARAEAGVIVFEDEASFRQTPTLHQTWAPRRAQPQIPTRGQRHTQKILGAVAIEAPCFVYRLPATYADSTKRRKARWIVEGDGSWFGADGVQPVKYVR